MQAIITKFIPATNTRGARIKATSGSGISITISYPHELNMDDRYRMAAIALCQKLGWLGTLAQGDTKNGAVFAFVSSDTMFDIPAVSVQTQDR